MSFSSEATTNLRATLDSACADGEKSLPGVVGVIVGKDGTEHFAHAAGKRGYGSSDAMTLDSIFWIASCTKMITGIACMQLVEQGKLSLDDPSQVEELCPEMRDLKVLLADGSLVEKKRGISLRMLLTHTGAYKPGPAMFLLSVHRVKRVQLASATPSSKKAFVTTANLSVSMSFPDILQTWCSR
jgi:CubicO group peptidase (beta-lactamase class C family)